MRVLIDTNLLLDVLLDRAHLADDSQAVIDWCEANPGCGFLAWHTLANLHYIGARAGNAAAVHDFLQALLRHMEVCPCGTAEAHVALALPVRDFEDALQVAAGQATGVDYIVTRNVKDFRRSPVPALSPEAFLKRT